MSKVQSMIYARHPILIIAESLDFCDHVLPVIVKMVMDGLPEYLDFMSTQEWENSLTYVEPEFRKGELEWKYTTRT